MLLKVNRYNDVYFDREQHIAVKDFENCIYYYQSGVAEVCDNFFCCDRRLITPYDGEHYFCCCSKCI